MSSLLPIFNKASIDKGGGGVEMSIYVRSDFST